MKKNFLLTEYDRFISHRNVWMGFAILWVIFFHFGNISVPFIDKITKIGYGGVDIFFFASGVGCWYSLNKSTDSAAFLKRRANRILPTYLPFIALFIVVKAFESNPITIQQILGNVFFVGNLFGMKNQFNWYLFALWMFYLCAPFLVGFVNKNIERKSKLMFLFAFLVIFSFCFIKNHNAIIVFSRMPIGLLGILSAAIGNQKKSMSLKIILSMLAASALGAIWLFINYKYFKKMLWPYGLHWYPFILITPGLCYIISFVSEKLVFIDKVLGYIGKHSFELYLSHIFLFSIVKQLRKTSDFVADNYKLSLFIAVLISFIFAIIFQKVIGILTKKMTPVTSREKSDTPKEKQLQAK